MFRPVGRYRCKVAKGAPEMAFADNGELYTFVARPEYEAQGYEPPFDSLPLEGEYRERCRQNDAAK